MLCGVCCRSGMLTRHRSLTEASQSLRQIHIPKKTSRAVRPCPCPFPFSPPTTPSLHAAPPRLPLLPHCLPSKPKVSELISDLVSFFSPSRRVRCLQRNLQQLSLRNRKSKVCLALCRPFYSMFLPIAIMTLRGSQENSIVTLLSWPKVIIIVLR